MATDLRPGPAVARMAMVDCSRGIAALLVCAYHAVLSVQETYGIDPLGGWFHFGAHGIDLFLVLSGFIITYVHWSDLGNPAAVPTYFLKRFIRIYPLLWVAAIPFILSRLYLASDKFPGEWNQKAEMILGSLFLFPTPQDPMPSVVWTLKLEVLFYLLYSLVLCWPRVGASVLGIWGALSAYNTFSAFSGLNANPFSSTLFNGYNLEFLMGIGCGYYLRTRSIRFPWALLFAGLVLFLVAGLQLDAEPKTGQVSLQFGCCSVLMILGMAQIDRNGGTKVPGWLGLLGAASYSIYLMHMFVQGFTCRLVLRLSPHATHPLAALFAAVVAGVLVGVLVHLAVEVPLLKFMRKTLLPSKTESTINPPTQAETALSSNVD